MMKIKHDMFNWYVIYTYPNYEKKVLKGSSQKNISCYLPTQKVVRQWSDRRKTIEIPLFPNYVFVYVSRQERFKILDVNGVANYVMHCGNPVIISDEDVDKIRRMAGERDIAVEDKLTEGSLVKIMDGPFTGMEGILFKKKGQDRFGVRIEGINQVLSIDTANLSFTSIAI